MYAARRAAFTGGESSLDRALPSSLTDALAADGLGLEILVVRLGAMGDVLRTLPAARLLRRAAPRAGIHWVVEQNWARVLDGHPDLDGLIAVPRKQLRTEVRSPEGWLRLPRTLGSLRRELRSRRAGLLLDFHGNLRSGLIAAMSGASVRLGYDGHQQKEGNRLFTTHRVPSGSRRTPRMTRNLDLLRPLGIPTDPLPDGGLAISTEGVGLRDSILAEAGLDPAAYGVMSPGASVSQGYKVPPTALLAAAAAACAEHGVRLLVVWGPDEQPLARAVAARAESTALAPATDLDTLRELIRGARIFVGGDTGPMHMACATATPVVAIYGPTDPQVNQPWGVPYRTVYPPGRAYTGIKRIDRVQGFEGIDAEQVRRAIDALFGEVD